MPNLAELTDAYDPMGNSTGLPVEQPYDVGAGNINLNNRPIVKNSDGTISTVKSKSFNFDGKEILLPSISDDGRVLTDTDIIDQYRKTGKNLGEFETTKEANDYAKKLHDDQDRLYTKPSAFSNKADKILNSLFRDDENRYQLWPEKVLREGLTAAGDVTKVNPHAVGSEAWDWYEDQRAKGMIPAAMSISALAGTGGLGGGAEGAALNATPSLRPALKYKDRLYKGKEGQQHMDVIPEALYPEFQKMAMSGEDISHYNFGFVNDKGHFMDREAALKYGIDSGIIDPQAGKFGALTSKLMADSSKPGVAIESLGKSIPKLESKLSYIDIPQSLKDQAMHKGFPLFSKGGFMLQPVDHEPEFK